MTNKEGMQTAAGLAMICLVIVGLIKLAAMKPYAAPVEVPVAAASKPAPSAPAAVAEVSLWHHSASTSPVDDVQTHVFAVQSNESGVGLPGETASLFVAFDEGQLRRSPKIGVGVSVNQVVDPLDYAYNEYRTAVRLRWDDEKPIRQIWERTNTYTTIYPPQGRAFLMQLLHHKRLALEFRFYPGTRETITFQLNGLSATLRSVGIAFEAENAAQYAAQAAARQAAEAAARKADAAARAAILKQIAPCSEFGQYPSVETDYCWRPADLAGIWKFDTKEEALEYAKEHYTEHSKPFFDH